MLSVLLDIKILITQSEAYTKEKYMLLNMQSTCIHSWIIIQLMNDLLSYHKWGWYLYRSSSCLRVNAMCVFPGVLNKWHTCVITFEVKQKPLSDSIHMGNPQWQNIWLTSKATVVNSCIIGSLEVFNLFSNRMYYHNHSLSGTYPGDINYYPNHLLLKWLGINETVYV